MKIFKRASTVKLLHRWAPTYTYLCRQGHHLSPLCPRCKTCVETNEHILQCSHPEASASRSCILLDSIDFLWQSNTTPLLLNTLHYKWPLALALPIPSLEQVMTESGLSYSTLQAIKHQNLLGWNTMLRGYISTYWSRAYIDLCEPQQEIPNPSWDISLTSTSTQIYKCIWESRNKYVNRSSKADQSQKVHLCISEQVRSIYKNPPRLHQRVPRIHKVSLEDHLRSPMVQLVHWLSRIQHQKQVSKILREKVELAQPSVRRFLTPLPVSILSFLLRKVPFHWVILTGFPASYIIHLFTMQLVFIVDT